MSLAPPEPQTESTERRRRGCYYTPRFVVRLMLDGCLTPLLRERDPLDSLPLRILDPACGDGAFLLEAFDVLHDWYRDLYRRHPGEFSNHLVRQPDGWQLTADERLRIVREHLFGVDVDRRAVELLRDRLFDRVNGREKPTGGNPWEDGSPCVPPVATGGLCRLAAIRDAIRRNIRVGDALTGPGFAIRDPVLFETKPAQDGESRAIDFREAFGQVARDGGFDVVIGNPPYRRELNAKGLFDRIAVSPLGRRWRQARMDLWYYFLHRGLDLLRPDGRLAFVVNSYWTASSGARKLIARLQRETTFEEIVTLGDAPVFADVAGRHLIFRLRSGRHPQDCRVIDLSESPLEIEDALRRLANHRDSPHDPAMHCYDLSHRDLYRHGQISLRRPDPVLNSMQTQHTLGDLYEVRQGMAENPPTINARLNREFGNRYRVGEGVFVLTPDEIEALELSEFERQFLRPYYPTSVLDRYHLPNTPAEFVLYLTPTTAPSLEGFRRLRGHLERFRPILERRRETRNGTRAWWQLHWPREERLFTEPRILSVQMGRVPQFVWAAQPTFVGFSVNLILAAPAEACCGRSPDRATATDRRSPASLGDLRSENRRGQRPAPNEGAAPNTVDALPLTALCGILNSSLAQRWFSAYAKRRGVNLEINGGLLRQFPLPASDAEKVKRLDELVSERQAIAHPEENEMGTARIARVERAIDDLVFQLYCVRPE